MFFLKKKERKKGGCGGQNPSLIKVGKEENP